MPSSRLILAAGSVCLAVVVLTHVAEALHLFPGMGWGLPNSPGHYLDLCSAIGAATLLVTAGVLRVMRSNREALPTAQDD